MTDINRQEKKFLLEKFVGYQDGAIVSREIFKNACATVTLFAFDKGQGLSAHKTPFAAMVYVVDGEVEVTIDKVCHFLKKGEMIQMPVNKLHALRAVSRFKMLLTMIKS